jgi:hypothetical protein
MRAAMSNHVSLGALSFPQLDYAAPHLRAATAGAAAWPACRAGRLRLGVASAFFSPTSSVLQVRALPLLSPPPPLSPLSPPLSPLSPPPPPLSPLPRSPPPLLLLPL